MHFDTLKKFQKTWKSVEFLTKCLLTHWKNFKKCEKCWNCHSTVFTTDCLSAKQPKNSTLNHYTHFRNFFFLNNFWNLIYTWIFNPRAKIFQTFIFKIFKILLNDIFRERTFQFWDLPLIRDLNLMERRESKENFQTKIFDKKNVWAAYFFVNKLIGKKVFKIITKV